MTYNELRKKQANEYKSFPKFFAFNDEQFKIGLRNLDAEENEVVHIRYGCFVRISDKKAYLNMLNRFSEELKQEIKNDSTGEGFIYTMFNKALADHEYCYTGDPNEAIESLGLSASDIMNNQNLKHGLELACKNQLGNSGW